MIAGPSCDSVDVLYEKEPYLLPVSLEIGSKVLIEGTGAYTTTYSSVGFNGFPPLEILCDLSWPCAVCAAIASWPGSSRPSTPRHRGNQPREAESLLFYL